MEYRVNQKKLLFLHYLVYLDQDSLAKQIFLAQKEYNFPGFVFEGQALLKFFNLPNIVIEDTSISKLQWKTMVKKAVASKFEEMIRGKIKKMTKLKDGPINHEIFETKSYLSEMSLTDARTLFRIRSQTTDVIMNQRSNKAHAKNLWKCSECGNIDTQSHILSCPFHAHLRERKSLENDSDLVEYMKKVFLVREELRNKEQQSWL